MTNPARAAFRTVQRLASVLGFVSVVLGPLRIHDSTGARDIERRMRALSWHSFPIPKHIVLVHLHLWCHSNCKRQGRKRGLETAAAARDMKSRFPPCPDSLPTTTLLPAVSQRTARQGTHPTRHLFISITQQLLNSSSSGKMFGLKSIFVAIAVVGAVAVVAAPTEDRKFS